MQLPVLDPFPVKKSRETVWILKLAHILFGKPAPTFPGYALACVGGEGPDRSGRCRERRHV